MRMRNMTPPEGDIREALQTLRDAVFTRSGTWAGRDRSSTGDVRAALLAAIGDEAKNGHQIMQAMSVASGGTWMPSAGAVYPLLQQLTDEGLLSAQHDGERTVYRLTDAGREAAATAQASHPRQNDREHERSGWNLPDWADRMSGRLNDRMSEHSTALPRAGAKLAQAAAQVAHSGTREQQERAAALIDETRRKLYAILAED